MKTKTQTQDLKRERKIKNGIFIHKVKCEHCGHIENEYPFEPLGVVQLIDVGKMCRKVKNGDESNWYVENQEQFEERMKKLKAKSYTLFAQALEDNPEVLNKLKGE